MCDALFLQIKGEQAVQEQATAWQDIIAAKKEAVGLQVESCFGEGCAGFSEKAFDLCKT